MKKLCLLLLLGGTQGTWGMTRLRRNLYSVEEETASEQEKNLLNEVDNVSQEEMLRSLVDLMSMSMSMMSMPLDNVWRFTVSAGIHNPTSEFYGGLEEAKKLVEEQYQTINSRFDSAFNNPLFFDVVNIYEFSGPVLGEDGEVFREHPEADYLVVYDGFPTQGGGWFGDFQSIHHSWPVDSSFGGPFESTATDGLVHEFGHSRGCIDIDGLRVDADKNPVNGQSYRGEASIMNIPFGVTVWDEHSISVVNSNRNLIPANLDYIQETWPTFIDFRALDSTGQGVEKVRIQLFRVRWFSFSVDPTREETLSLETDADGRARWFMSDTNLFGPGCGNCPWFIETPNFLVEFAAAPFEDEGLRYEWLPFNEVQNAQPAEVFEVSVMYSSGGR